MAARSLQVHVHDWQDRDFVHAFETALSNARAAREAVDVDAARQVQAALRTCGYVEARVECLTGVDDVLSGIAHWAVRRGSPADPTH